MDASADTEDTRTAMVGRKRDLDDIVSSSVVFDQDLDSEERSHKRAKQDHEPLLSPLTEGASAPKAPVSWNKSVQSELRTSFGNKSKVKAISKANLPILSGEVGKAILESSPSAISAPLPTATSTLHEVKEQEYEASRNLFQRLPEVSTALEEVSVVRDDSQFLSTDILYEEQPGGGNELSKDNLLIQGTHGRDVDSRLEQKTLAAHAPREDSDLQQSRFGASSKETNQIETTVDSVTQEQPNPAASRATDPAQTTSSSIPLSLTAVEELQAGPHRSISSHRNFTEPLPLSDIESFTETPPFSQLIGINTPEIKKKAKGKGKAGSKKSHTPLQYYCGKGEFSIPQLIRGSAPVTLAECDFYTFVYHFAKSNPGKVKELKLKQVKVCFEKFVAEYLTKEHVSSIVADKMGTDNAATQVLQKALLDVKDLSFAEQAFNPTDSILSALYNSESKSPDKTHRKSLGDSTSASCTGGEDNNEDKSDDSDSDSDIQDLSIDEDLEAYSAQELALQQRYFPSVNGAKSNARCFVCGDNAHKTFDCPAMSCGSCGGDHRSTRCPQNQRCAKCFEKGHSMEDCREKLMNSKRSAVCELCTTKGHVERECHMVWRSYAPSVEEILLVTNIPIFCYSCGADGHYGPECGLQGGTEPLSGGRTWSRANRDTYVHEQYRLGPAELSKGLYSLPPRPDRVISIKGMANNPITLDDGDDDVSFLQAKVKIPSRDRSNKRTRTPRIEVHILNAPRPHLQLSNEVYGLGSSAKAGQSILPHENKQSRYEREISEAGVNNYQYTPQQGAGRTMGERYEETQPIIQEDLIAPANYYSHQELQQHPNYPPPAGGGHYNGPPPPTWPPDIRQTRAAGRSNGPADARGSNIAIRGNSKGRGGRGGSSRLRGGGAKTQSNVSTSRGAPRGSRKNGSKNS